MQIHVEFKATLAYTVNIRSTRDVYLYHLKTKQNMNDLSTIRTEVMRLKVLSH